MAAEIAAISTTNASSDEIDQIVFKSGSTYPAIADTEIILAAP